MLGLQGAGVAAHKVDYRVRHFGRVVIFPVLKPWLLALQVRMLRAAAVTSDDEASFVTTSSAAFGDCCTLGELEQMVHSGFVIIGLRCRYEAL